MNTIKTSLAKTRLRISKFFGSASQLASYQRYVAFKVLRADCYGGSHDIFEKEILSRILEVSNKSSHRGRNHVLSLLDQFKHTGPMEIISETNKYTSRAGKPESCYFSVFVGSSRAGRLSTWDYSAAPRGYHNTAGLGDDRPSHQNN
ncbi:serine/threonine protein kinase [Coccidioides immitis H538.4]|uniref:Serine/threonine protein kinase n=2 Tax=Coccidioides immitis TaxID=5501 RepID=A0A0J8S0U8_COCIT|nr:serine/threonine protein kinase [Coccidioides immitis RMSCC 2394]KMU91050.1 serine/threonine protein kinase [Coccidioides immitis H538.4]